MKIATVVGARPNFVKQAMVSEQLRGKHREVLIHTGQHYQFELSKIFFEQLEITEPHYNLDIGSGTHGQQTGQMLIEIEKVLIKEKPDWVIIYGDTNSTLAGALAAVKLNIPIAHIEAGLRAYNKKIPEEVNRMIADYAAKILFAPTQTAVDNLKKENMVDGVFNTGDVMYDAVLKYQAIAENTSDILSRLSLKPDSYFLATIHRPGTTDNDSKLRSIITALAGLDEKIIFPIHPRTREAINRLDKSLFQTTNITLVDPVGYLDMLMLVKNSKLVITDSGGLQKECYFLKTPCVTCLEEDEWPETTAAGANRLVGTDTNKIIEAVNQPYFPFKDADEFGDGHAAEKMIKLLEET